MAAALVPMSSKVGLTMKFEMFSVASRTPEISQENLDKVKAIVNENIPQYNLDSSKGLYWTKQNDWCKYQWQFDQSTNSDEATKFLLWKP